MSAFSSHLVALNIPVSGFDLGAIPDEICQVVKQSTFYFETARNPNCASKGKESEKVTVVGVVGSYDSGGTTVIVYSCSIQSPGDQIKMLSQPSPLLESGSGPHFCANMPCRWNSTPSSGGSDISHRPSPLRSCQAAILNDSKQSDMTSGVGVTVLHELKNSTTIVIWMVDVIFLVFTFSFLILRKPLNGMRYPLVGGTRQRHFDGANSKPRKLPENAPTPTSRVQLPRMAGHPSIHNDQKAGR